MAGAGVVSEEEDEEEGEERRDLGLRGASGSVGGSASIGAVGSSGQLQLRCPLANCNAVYVRRPRFLDHIRTQHPEEAARFVSMQEDVRPFKCPLSSCECSYVRKGDLKAHVLKAHAMEAQTFPDIIKPKSTKDGKDFPCPAPGCDCGYKRHSDLYHRSFSPYEIIHLLMHAFRLHRKYHFTARHFELLKDYPEFGRVKLVSDNRTCRECNARFPDQVRDSDPSASCISMAPDPCIAIGTASGACACSA